MRSQKYVYEITFCSASDAYIKNPALFKPAANFICQNAPGPVYSGLQLDDPQNILTGFVGWNSVQQRKEFEQKPLYANIGPKVQRIVSAGESTEYHVSFEGDEIACFEAPVTELVWITPQLGVNIDDVAKLVAQVAKKTYEIKKSKRLDASGRKHECFGAAWGRVMEKDMIVYIAGWSSVEAHDDFAKDIAVFANKAAMGIAVHVRHGDHFHVKRASYYDDVATATVSYLALQDSRAEDTKPTGDTVSEPELEPETIEKLEQVVSRPVYEVIQFPTSQRYLQDHSTFRPVADFIGKHAPGAIYAGLQVEDPKDLLTGFVGWQSVQQHEDFEKQPVYVNLTPLVAPIAAGDSVVYHASFEGAHESDLFNAPFTELTLITPTGGATADDIEPLVKYAADLCNQEVGEGKRMNKDGTERENYGAAWGRVVGEDIFLYLGGWSDPKAHAAWVETWETPMNEKTRELKIGRHHWVRTAAKKYSDVVTQKTTHLQLTNGRASGDMVASAFMGLSISEDVD